MKDKTSSDLNALINICHSNLKNSKECLSYLRKRGMTKSSIINNKIGFFPQNVRVLKKYISEETLNKTNIINLSGNSDFSHYFYLVFPIYSEFGDPVGISGRTLSTESERKIIGIPKYKNSSYKKSNVLYGLDKSKKSILKNNNVYVLEGYFDYLSMVNNGFENSVAICGTAFSNGHFLKLARYTDKITFILDSDEAGLKSAQRIYSKFINKGIKLRFLKAPESIKDVDQYFSESKSSNNSFFNDFKQTIPEVW